MIRLMVHLNLGQIVKGETEEFSNSPPNSCFKSDDDDVPPNSHWQVNICGNDQVYDEREEERGICTSSRE